MLAQRQKKPPKISSTVAVRTAVAYICRRLFISFRIIVFAVLRAIAAVFAFAFVWVGR